MNAYEEAIRLEIIEAKDKIRLSRRELSEIDAGVYGGRLSKRDLANERKSVEHNIDICTAQIEALGSALAMAGILANLRQSKSHISGEFYLNDELRRVYEDAGCAQDFVPLGA